MTRKRSVMTKKRPPAVAYHVGLDERPSKAEGFKYVLQRRFATTYWASPAPEPKKRYLP
jgi:hypothetical protein